MFEKLIKSLRAAGLQASAAEMFAGYYFDGAEHGRAFPVVRAEAEYSFPVKRLEGICKRWGLVFDRYYHYGCGVVIFTVWAADDRAEARRLDNIALAFRGAFEKEHNRQYIESGRTDCILPGADVAACVAAGRAAVAALGVNE